MSTSDKNSPPELTVDDYVEGVLSGDRALLAQTITLIESARRDSDLEAQEVLTRLLPHSGKSHRVGITGIPGVGKSTLIESLGGQLIEAGHRVAVLAVDPTSTVSGGSILGDKSRMPTLANNPNAIVRPSPNALTPGGVGRRTRETQIVCEAAGYDIVLIETVGVGQSEIMVAQMVDTFIALMLPGAGDELQGIKKGVLELADIVVVNKADGENLSRALEAKREYDSAMRYLRHRSSGWQPPVELLSALSGEGIERLWDQVEGHLEFLKQDGELERRRRDQRKHWMWSLIEERLMKRFRRHSTVQSMIAELEERVMEGTVTASDAVRMLLDSYSDDDLEPS
jgi:LAO/AO transport system kinase